MRLRFIPEAAQAIAESPHVLKEPQQYKGKWKEPGQRLFIEIGSGKGQFLLEMAARYPEDRFVGVEMYESVLLRAVQKMDALGEECPRNLSFLRMDARLLPDVFEAGEVDGIYLNFSDPWPKARHAKRRLTSRNFLALYEQVMRPEGRVVFKTDNQDLFTFSLEEIEEAKHFRLLSETRDLYADPELVKDNIQTEYEYKFRLLGKKICRLAAVFEP